MDCEAASHGRRIFLKRASLLTAELSAAHFGLRGASSFCGIAHRPACRESGGRDLSERPPGRHRGQRAAAEITSGSHLLPTPSQSSTKNTSAKMMQSVRRDTTTMCPDSFGRFKVMNISSRSIMERSEMSGSRARISHREGMSRGTAITAGHMRGRKRSPSSECGAASARQCESPTACVRRPSLP